MAKRKGRRVNPSPRSSSSKQNSTSSPPLTASPRTDPSFQHVSDYPSDEEPMPDIHEGSEIPPATLHVGSEKRRRGRSSTRLRTDQRSWPGTLAALCAVHAVLLVAYGVHSKWQWAIELVVGVPAVLMSVLLCLYCVYGCLA